MSKTSEEITSETTAEVLQKVITIEDLQQKWFSEDEVEVMVKRMLKEMKKVDTTGFGSASGEVMRKSSETIIKKIAKENGVDIK